MKKIFNAVAVFILVLIMPFTASANVPDIALNPNTGDTAIMISVVLVVVAVALFIFIRRRKR